jgi:hypothetical protein
VIGPALDKNVAGSHCNELRLVQKHIDFAFDAYDVVDRISAMEMTFIAGLELHHRKAGAARGRG